jgi:hypothetical protein
MIVLYRCCTGRSSANTSEISKFIVQILSFAGFSNLTGKFNITVVKTLKPVFYVSLFGVLLIFKEKH